MSEWVKRILVGWRGYRRIAPFIEVVWSGGAMTGWQPVETAPMEVPYPGVDLWMRGPDDDGKIEEGRVTDCWKRNGNWVRGVTGIRTEDERYAAALVESRITHWMPLPEPPK
jgi:hypothetical protein